MECYKILISVKLSPHKKIPIIKEGGIEHWFWNYPRHVWDFQHFEILEDKPDLVIVSYRNHVLKFPRYYWNILHAEWGRVWSRDYLPKGGIKGKTVIDAGAGVGETALFFLSKGAKKIVAFESDPSVIDYLMDNMRDFPVECYCEPFKATTLLDFDYDFAKIDCEQEGDLELMKLKELPPRISAEVHSPELLKALTEKFPQFRNLGKNEAGSWIVKYP